MQFSGHKFESFISKKGQKQPLHDFDKVKDAGRSQNIEVNRTKKGWQKVILASISRISKLIVFLIFNVNTHVIRHESQIFWA